LSDPTMPTHHGIEAEVNGDYPNETLRLLHQRGSCRHFKDEEIPEDVLDLLLGAAVNAPSGGNLQSFNMVKIEEPERREKLMKICGNQKFIGEAPLNLVICLDQRRSMRWAELDCAPFTALNQIRSFLMGVQLTGIVGQAVCVAADALGLGSCYVGTALARAGEISEFLELPRGVFPGVLISIGYPAEKLTMRRKHRLSTLLHDERHRDLPDDELLAAYKEKHEAAWAPRVEITERRLKTLYNTCLKVHGEEYAEKSVAHAREIGYISPVQRYFGLHYRADSVFTSPNSEFVKVIERQGWNICGDYEPSKG